ncbi:5813_t:CDS:2 [Entrophospora sp. SA101]|nr:5813_t:CDS:2 [Entrophospora sp. SA101]
MTNEACQKITKKIKKHSTIICLRHIDADGDAYGSAMGLAQLIKDNFPEKKVFTDGKNNDSLSFLGKNDQLEKRDYQNSLIIISDTASQERIDRADANYLCTNLYQQNLNLLKFKGHVLKEFILTKPGVAFLKITAATLRKYNINRLEAKSYVISEIAEKYNGGGHKFAAGAKIKAWVELDNLVADLDKLINKPAKVIEKSPSNTTENQENNTSPPGTGTEYKKAVIEANMLPRGSAILTGSGDLEKQGIKAIIHACPGAIQKNAGSEFEPNIQGIIHSVQNSIILAEKNNYKSIAFCLVGSSFLDRIFPNQGTKKEKQLKLAEIIIKSAVEQRKSLEKIVFVDFGNTAFMEVNIKIGTESYFRKKLGIVSILFCGNNSITDYSSHKCEVIVNSLNMEGEFISSGSFSGFIAKKTGSRKSKIQKKIKEHITEFNKRLKNKSI